jgi:hypothetical protein
MSSVIIQAMGEEDMSYQLLVEVTPDFVALCNRAIENYAGVECDSMSYETSAVTGYFELDLPDYADEALEEVGWAVLKPDEQVDDRFSRYYFDVVYLHAFPDGGFQFEGHPKFASVRLYSETFYLDMIQAWEGAK